MVQPEGVPRQEKRSSQESGPAAEASGTVDAAPRKRPRVRRLLLRSLAVMVVLTLAVSGLGVWSVVRAFPQTSGTIRAAGLQSEVTVQRDGHGIPTITASSTGDLFFAQGFVHAQDRFWEMDFRRHMTSGRLSELFGESQLATDTFLRTLGWHRIAQQEVEALPDEVRAHYESYAAGVNTYLQDRQGGALSLEYTVLGLQNPDYSPEPWTPADSAAWLKAMAWDLRTNLEDETTRALLAQELETDRLVELYPGYPYDEHPVIMAEDPSGTDIADGIPAASAARVTDTPEGAGGSGSTEAVESGDRTNAHSATPPDLTALTGLLGTVDPLISAQGEGIGSNAWVVSGEHTDTGAPLLANDPHLGAAMPSVWTQMQLRCETVTEECPFDVAGFGFSGLPGIVIGHNRHVAWGFTNLTTDVADLYVERVEDDGYWLDGERLPFETRRETIRVAGGEDVEVDVRSTGNGPIVSDLTPEFTDIAADPRTGTASDGEERPQDPVSGTERPPDEYAVSLRWTALDPGATAQALFTLNLAGDFADFRRAASQFDVPAQNLVYADVRGNIGYQSPGRLPVRGAGDGWLPQPGWDSAYSWQGFIPFEELPVALNPDAGYIVTANNAIVDEDYPFSLGDDWDYGDRAARIVTLLEEQITAGPVTAADMAEIHMDNRSPAAEPLRNAYAGIDVSDAGVREALGLLADWDGQNDADSAAAAFANVLWNRVTSAMIATQGADIPRDDQSRLVQFFTRQLEDVDSPWWGGGREELLRTAAEDAYAELSQRQGADPEGWDWGELHAITLRNATFGESGIAPVEALFNRGPYAVSGGSGVVNATGWDLDEGYETGTVPSMRMVIDLADWDASTWQHLTGASGHAFHRNYTDQTEGWARGEQYAWHYSAEAVRAATGATLTLEPG